MLRVIYVQLSISHDTRSNLIWRRSAGGWDCQRNVVTGVPSRDCHGESFVNGGMPYQLWSQRIGSHGTVSCGISKRIFPSDFKRHFKLSKRDYRWDIVYKAVP